MSFDWKGILEKSGAVIAVAEAARDGIVGRINKELEQQIEKLGRTLYERDRDIRELREKLERQAQTILQLEELLAKKEAK